MAWLRRLLNVFRPARVDRDIDREIVFHLQERTDALRGEGLDENDARRQARRQFGSPLLQRERTRDVDITHRLDALLRTLRYTIRALLRAPSFTATAVLTLGLGIGATTAVFSVVNGVLLKPLPCPDPDALIVGVYGVIAYAVSRRQREIGIRLALGAGRAGILRLFLGHGVRVAALACAGGAVLSAFFTRALSGMLFGVSPADPATLSAVVALVLVVASLAALVPAARAAWVEPMRVLRGE